jgi:hypothetical protein
MEMSALAPVFAPSPIDLGLDLAHLLVGDDQKVARSACRIEDTDVGHPFPQVQQLDGAVAGAVQVVAQVIEEERVQHLQDVRHRGVVHPQLRAFLLIRDGLDHGAKDVGVDLVPGQPADLDQVTLGDEGEFRHFFGAAEEPAVHVGKDIGPIGEARLGTICDGRVHGPENLTNHLMGVRPVPCREGVDGGGEEVFANQDVRVLGKEAEDQPGHEVVHVMAAGAPIRVVGAQGDVELVEPEGGANVEL